MSPACDQTEGFVSVTGLGAISLRSPRASNCLLSDDSLRASNHRKLRRLNTITSHRIRPLLMQASTDEGNADHTLVTSVKKLNWSDAQKNF
jgi:hypothetical protein